MVRQVNPLQAREALEHEAVYLDVRTTGEFEKGHPPGARNVPVVFLEPGRPPVANADFGAVVEKHFDKAAKIIVGCLSGGRSMKAAEILEKLGYTDVTNMAGGFGGARDASGRTIEKGWIEHDLPVETGAPAGQGYEELRGAR